METNNKILQEAKNIFEKVKTDKKENYFLKKSLT